MNKMYRYLFLLVLLANTASCFIVDTFLGSAVQPVKELDVQKYLGRWYQMYGSQSVYITFERGAYCVTADYTLANDGTGRIKVLNSERLNSGTGPKKVIHGYATPSGTPGKLSVNLETVPFDAPYWVIKLGPATYGPNNQYQYAVVSDNFKATLFVLARDPDDFEKNYQAEVMQFLHDNGFTLIVNKPVKTYQQHDCIYNDQHL